MTATPPRGFFPKTLHDPDAALVRLNDLVADADAGFASRLVASHEGGKTILLTLAAGQELAEHAAPFAVLVVVLDGEVTFTVGGAARRVRAGEALRLAPGASHAVRADVPVRLLLVLHRA